MVSKNPQKNERSLAGTARARRRARTEIKPLLEGSPKKVVRLAKETACPEKRADGARLKEGGEKALIDSQRVSRPEDFFQKKASHDIRKKGTSAPEEEREAQPHSPLTEGGSKMLSHSPMGRTVKEDPSTEEEG